MSKRYLMWSFTTFVLSIFSFTYLPAGWFVGVVTFALISMIPALVIKYSFKRLIITCQASLLAAALFFTASIHANQKLETSLAGTTAHISGVVTDCGVNSAGNLDCYTVRLLQCKNSELPFYQKFQVYLYTDTNRQYAPGTLVSGELDLYDTSVEFGFGREDRVFLSAYTESELLTFTQPLKANFYRKFYRFRTTVQERLSYGSDVTRGLLRAVCFGDKGTLEPELNISMRRIGLSHVTAVSGLHLSFAILLFNWLLMLLGIRYRVRYILNIFVAVFFTLVVGCPLSCVRACVMLVIFSIGMALDLFPDGLTSLSVAAFLIVVFNPYAVRDVGFILSVSATAGIITMSLPIEHFLFPPKIAASHFWIGVYRKFTGVFAASVAAMISTMPFVWLFFGSISIVGPVANLILIYPLQAFFIMGMLMILFGWIPGVGTALGFLCDILYVAIDRVAAVMGRLSFSSITGLNLVSIVALCLLLAILGVAIYDFIKHHRRSFLMLLVMLICFIGCFHSIYSAAHHEDNIEVAFIDVGQGDCTVISKDNRAVIVDYGGSSDKRYNLIEYLKRKNIYIVELLAFTHLHNDHTNGTRTLLNNVYVDRILYPETGEIPSELSGVFNNAGATKLRGDETIQVLDNVSLSLIAEADFDSSLSKNNERCVCYRVSYGETTVLVTGDLAGEAEAELLDRELECTILKVAHHGSVSSSLYPFIKAAAPEVAVISAGDNSYGLPKQSVIKRLETVCPLVLQTLEDGNIIFQTDGITMERIS